MVAGWSMMRYIGQIPDSTSKAIAAFGVATLLDPLLIFLIDIMASNYNCSKVRAHACMLGAPRGTERHDHQPGR
jgi:hypothetical protein